MHIPKAKLPFYPPCEVKYRLQNRVSAKTEVNTEVSKGAFIRKAHPLLGGNLCIKWKDWWK